MESTTIFDERLTSYGRLVEVHRRLDNHFSGSFADQHGLSATWFEALLRIGRSPDRRLMMRELAQQTDLTTGGVTRLVDAMATADLVRRSSDPGDRRVQLIELTGQGAAKLEAAATTHLHDLDAELFDRLTTDEIARLDALLDKLRHA